MYSRYGNRVVRANNNELYRELFEERGIRQVRQYLTPSKSELTTSQRMMLNTTDHTWKTGDRLWKLASQYYGDATLWWVIAWYNEKPTDSHYLRGSTVYVPFPLGRILAFYDKG
jgi:nucleoid-associated protein YgaU